MLMDRAARPLDIDAAGGQGGGRRARRSTSKRKPLWELARGPGESNLPLTFSYNRRLFVSIQDL